MVNFQRGDKVRVLRHKTRKYVGQEGVIQAFCGSEERPGAVVQVNGEAPIVALEDLKPVRRVKLYRAP